MIGFELVDTEEVLKAVQSRGPLIPMEIKNILKKGDSMVIGAALSDLSSRAAVKVTNVKRGGSPFYYVSGQEPKLESISNWLNEKDKRSYEFLRSKKVLRDSKQDPLTRFSLREIKDYAKQINVKVNGQDEIFWRYYLISEKDAIELIKGMFKQKPAEPKKIEKIPVQKKPIEEEQKILDEVKPEEFLSDVKDEFLTRIKRFFSDKSILIKEAKLNRKGSDYEFVIEMVTPMGRAEYFCKAKGKKKCNDGDLSTAYLQGQMKRLPVVFITTGEVAKKAKEKVSTDYKGMILKEI